MLNFLEDIVGVAAHLLDPLDAVFDLVHNATAKRTMPALRSTSCQRSPHAPIR
jgi:hypothetical protein